MRAAQRPRPRVKACRRASDRRVTPAGQHAAGIPGRSASQRPVSSWLLPGTSRGSDRRPADAHPLPSHARHRDDNDVGDRRSRDRPEARPPARRGSHATVPHSRSRSTLSKPDGDADVAAVDRIRQSGAFAFIAGLPSARRVLRDPAIPRDECTRTIASAQEESSRPRRPDECSATHAIARSTGPASLSRRASRTTGRLPRLARSRNPRNPGKTTATGKTRVISPKRVSTDAHHGASRFATAPSPGIRSRRDTRGRDCCCSVGAARHRPQRARAR
jgi:hypothetical protein